jgi:hypothetical protein
MAKYTRNEVEAMLSKGIYKVTFTKVTDASLCTMICTRDFDWLRSEGIADEMDYVDPKGGICLNPALKVWCIERQREDELMEEIKGWRSFFPETIESIEFFSPTRVDDSFYENGEGVEI